MRVWTIVGVILLLSLTGCQSIEKQREEQTKAHTYIVESHIEDDVWRDQTKWETLLNQLSKHNNLSGDEGIYMQKLNDNMVSENLGIMFANGIIHFYRPITEAQINDLELAIGPEIRTFLDEANHLEEQECMERIINGYGLSYIKYNDENSDLYIIESGLAFKNHTLQEKIDTLCDDELLVSAISQGDDKQIIELAYPLQLENGGLRNDECTPAYYRLTLDKEGNIEKIRLVISYFSDGDRKFSKEKYARLNKILEQINGRAIDTTVLEQDIATNMKSNNKKTKGTLDGWKYVISNPDTDFRYNKLTVVELERN